MKIDQLSIADQKTATYCHSCGDVCPDSELDLCPDCGYRVCGKVGCSSLCACDDAASDLLLSLEYQLGVIDARIAKGGTVQREYTETDFTGMNAVIRDCDRIIASYGVAA